MQRIILYWITSCALIFAASTTSKPATRDYQTLIHDANKVEMCITNYGTFGQNSPYGSGCWWPKGSGHNYIWGAGAWFGAIVNNDTLVSVGYNPRWGSIEFVPGSETILPTDPLAIVYMYPSNWPPPLEAYPCAPQEAISFQDSWCAYNDLDPTAHEPDDTRPIGIEIYQTVYAWDLSSIEDVIFITYHIKNVSGDTLENCYMGVCTDNDIGSESGYGNDRIAGIVGRPYVLNGETYWVDNLGYQWQEVAEPGWDEFPGTIAFDFLQSPWDLVPGADKDHDGIPDQYERDSVYYYLYLPDTLWDVDFDGTPDWRDPSQIPQIGMTAFKRFIRGLEPNQDSERYLTLAGYDFSNNYYAPYDTHPAYPNDQRFLQSSGPFDLFPDSTATMLVAIMFANWHDDFGMPDTALVIVDHWTQFIYDMNWLLPGPPPPPHLTCVPGDAQITLVWNAMSEQTPDEYFTLVGTPDSPLYDSFYQEFDFEGYGIWRSLPLDPYEWVLLGRCDLYNDITFEDTLEPESIRIVAENTGLRHSFIDFDVRNGFSYAYAITAFDYNYISKDTFDSLGQPVTIPHPIWFESQKQAVSAVPRREPANYIPGTVSIIPLSCSEEFAQAYVDAAIVFPLMMAAGPLTVTFGPIVRAAQNTPRYSVFLSDAAGTPIDSLAADMGIGEEFHHEFSMVHGLAVTVLLQREDIPSDKPIFESIITVSGTYPESLLVPSCMPANWAYRGHDYEIRWTQKNPGDSVNTVEVTDIANNEEISYKPYFNPQTDDSLADGWCFQSATAARDTLVRGNAGTGTRYLYICGGRFSIAWGWMDIEPRPSENDIWQACADAAYPPAPAYATLAIQPTPAQMRTDTTFTLNVKVVPNPYIIHNEWQYSFNSRRIRFINLPAECLIRIFSLNGDLIKVIPHSHTRAVSDGADEVPNDLGGDEWWNLISNTNHGVVSGVYIFHVSSDVGEQVGKFVIIR